jgi:hypothetical protein
VLEMSQSIPEMLSERASGQAIAALSVGHFSIDYWQGCFPAITALLVVGGVQGGTPIASIDVQYSSMGLILKNDLAPKRLGQLFRRLLVVHLDRAGERNGFANMRFGVL